MSNIECFILWGREISRSKDYKDRKRSEGHKPVYKQEDIVDCIGLIMAVCLLERRE